MRSKNLNVTILYRATAAAVYHKTYHRITSEELREIMKDRLVIRITESKEVR